jgi:predicted outer membrane protein/lipid-binding SYLF domain-containing protein
MRAVAIAAVGLMAITAPAHAQTGSATPAAATQQTTQNTEAVQEFVDKAAMIDMYEMEAAHVAELKTSNPEYKSYASMIVTDHSNMASDLKRQVADSSGSKLPAGLDQEHRRKLDSLKSESGASFEKNYRQGQIDGHKRAIGLFQDFANSAPKNQSVDLKSWARASVPILQKHLQRAENLPVGGQVVGAAASGSVHQNGVTTGNAQNAALSSAQNLVDESVKVVKRMEDDSQLADAMKRAKGIYIVPEFGRGAVVVGARGGAGVVTVRKDGKWSDPAFYDFGAISVGPQVGGSGGAVAFLLMSQGAVDAFKGGNKFSLNAGAGLSIVNYSADGQASWGKGDIVMWSNTSGAYVGATITLPISIGTIRITSATTATMST